MHYGVWNIDSMFAGRFDRRQMATYYWRSEGPLSLNTAGAKRRRALSVWNSDRHQSRNFLILSVSCCTGSVSYWLLSCFCFLALTEGARRATGVSAKKHRGRHLFRIRLRPPALQFPDRVSLQLEAMRAMYQPV